MSEQSGIQSQLRSSKSFQFRVIQEESTSSLRVPEGAQQISNESQRVYKDGFMFVSTMILTHNCAVHI